MKDYETKDETERLLTDALNDKNDIFLKSCAYAHACHDSNYNFKNWCAFYDGRRFKLTTEQKRLSLLYFTEKREKAYLLTRQDILIFIPMGMTDDSINDIQNHRIRSHFISNDGVTFFVELSYVDGLFTCDHALIYYETPHETRLSCEHKTIPKKFTLRNVLNFVNKTFNCDFKHIRIDDIFLSCDRVLSISPKLYMSGLDAMNEKIRIKNGLVDNNYLFNLTHFDKTKYLQQYFSLGYDEKGELSFITNALNYEGWSNSISIKNCSGSLDLILKFFENQRIPYILDEGTYKNKILELLKKYPNKLFLCREKNTGSFVYHYFPNEDYRECAIYPFENGLYHLKTLEGVE